jgi:hypothetical protein
MRQRSSLRLASNQILWATPDSTLLTGIYAEDHIAANKAKGLPTDELVVYELHPYLKVVHRDDEWNLFDHRVAKDYDLRDWRHCGSREVSVGDFCLLNFPGHSSLDDEYISRPPVKEIEVYMRHTHEDNLNIRNNDGIKFKDIRAAVRAYLIEYAYDTNWDPCSNTTTFFERMANSLQPHGQRWAIQSGPSMIYNCELIFFDCVCFSIVIVFSLASLEVMPLTIDVVDIVIMPVILAFLQYYARFHITPIRFTTVLSERSPNEHRRCGHSLNFNNGVPITTEEILTLEQIGVITETNDPYCRRCGA